jgi:hypothetical protein
MFDNLQLGRRALLKALGLTIPAFMVSPLNVMAGLLRNNNIIAENRNAGTTAWQITKFAANRQIEGYASQTSINRGESIQIFVNTTASSYKLEVFRLGWYGGLGGRRMFGPITLSGTEQVIPQPDPVTGLAECNWINPFILQTSSTWTSGVYLGLLTEGNTQTQSYFTFTLRNDGGSEILLFQTSVTTYHAYNNWGGKSLYDFNSTGGPAVKVSFNRPYVVGAGAGDLFQYELCTLRHLEREGYDVAYTCDVTTHRASSSLNRHRAFLSVGHDEYWSLEMRQNVTAARDRGVDLGFFGANNCYWQIRFEPSTLGGAANRTMVCYKERFEDDPLFGVNNSLVTTLWRDPLVNQPEEQLIGVQYDFYPVDTDLVVFNASHWIFRGTGLINGDHLPGLLGYEADRSFGGGPANLIRLCVSPVSNPPLAAGLLSSSAELRSSSTEAEDLDNEDRTGDRRRRSISAPQTTDELVRIMRNDRANIKQEPQGRIRSRSLAGPVGNSEMTIYTAPSGALVFATGSMQFNWGLDDAGDPERTRFVNPNAQRMVRNLFRRF